MNDTWIPGIRFDHLPDAEAICASIGYIYFHPVHDHVIARVSKRDKSFMGGVIYTQYTGQGGSVTTHIAGVHANWLNRATLWTIFDYPFNQLGVGKIIAPVPAGNVQSAQFVKNLGFEVEHVIKGVYPHEDCLLMSITRDACRFLKMPPPKLEPSPNG